jgi:hypothetical protein
LSLSVAYRPHRLHTARRRIIYSRIDLTLGRARHYVPIVQRLFELISELEGIPVPPYLEMQCQVAVSDLQRASSELAGHVTNFIDSPLRQFWRDHGFASEESLFHAMMQVFDLWAAITLYIGHCWLKAYALSIDLMNAGEWLQEPSAQSLHLTTIHLQLMYQRMAAAVAAFIADIEAQDPAALTNHRYFTHPALHRPEDALSLPLSPTPGLYSHTNPTVAALLASSPFAVALHVENQWLAPNYPPVALNAADLAANLALASAPPGNPVLTRRERGRLLSLLSNLRMLHRQAQYNVENLGHLANMLPAWEEAQFFDYPLEPEPEVQLFAVRGNYESDESDGPPPLDPVSSDDSSDNSSDNSNDDSNDENRAAAPEAGMGYIDY